MFNPLTLFKTVKSGAITVAVIAAITFTGTIWVQKYWAEQKVVELELAKKEVEDKLFVEQVKVHGLNTVITTLESTFIKITANLQKEAEIEKEINDAPPEDDAPTAPVLSRAMRSLDRMLHDN
jgi:hypothetical protein